MLKSRRLVAAAAVAALALAGLTACSGGASGGCTPQVGSGAASDAVAASGAFATAPTVAFSSPLHTDDTQASTLIAGSGDPVRAGQEIVADLTIVNGTTGVTVTKTGYGTLAKAASFVVGGSTLPGLQQALVCARVGERIVAVVPPSQGVPAAQRGSAIGATDSIVVVADVRRAYLAKADGTDQVMAGGLPAVVLAPSGQPGITLPDHPAPTTLTIANLKDGSGAQLHAGDTAIVQYTGWTWNTDGTAAVFDSSWQKGSPVAFPVKQSAVIRGFYRALLGQRVGSQVIAVIPAKDAYGSTGDSSAGIAPGATLVFVADVLGKA